MCVRTVLGGGGGGGGDDAVVHSDGPPAGHAAAAAVAWSAVAMQLRQSLCCRVQVRSKLIW